MVTTDHQTTQTNYSSPPHLFLVNILTRTQTPEEGTVPGGSRRDLLSRLLLHHTDITRLSSLHSPLTCLGVLHVHWLPDVGLEGLHEVRGAQPRPTHPRDRERVGGLEGSSSGLLVSRSVSSNT